MKIPSSVDKTPRGAFVRPAKIGTKGYIDNEQCMLEVKEKSDGIVIKYYSEDDYYLTNDEVISILRKFNK